MPTLSVFIRKDDVERWKAIPNKSEFLHKALNATHVSGQTLTDLGKSLDEMCKGHDNFKRNCGLKGCKYA